MKDKIIEILMLATFTTRKQMLDHLHSMGVKTDDREMRKQVESLIVDDHYCIQSSNKGYSLIRDEKDLQAAMVYLDKKAAPIAVRKNCLLRNFRENKVGQLKVFA